MGVHKLFMEQVIASIILDEWCSVSHCSTNWWAFLFVLLLRCHFRLITMCYKNVLVLLTNHTRILSRCRKSTVVNDDKVRSFAFIFSPSVKWFTDSNLLWLHGTRIRTLACTMCHVVHYYDFFTYLFFQINLAFQERLIYSKLFVIILTTCWHYYRCCVNYCDD